MRKLAALVLIALLAVPAFAQQKRKYGVQTTVKFSLVDPAGVDLEIAAACATGDIKISKNEGAFANTSNCFTNEGDGDYSVVLTSAEMQAARITISVKDSPIKQWLDWNVYVETYGDTAAQHAVDLDAGGYAESVEHILTGTVDNSTLTPTSSMFEAADRTESTGILTGQWIKWTSGVLQGSTAYITSYVLVSGKGRFAVTPMIAAPANGDTFIIL